jgi:hypothetical protein
MATSLTLQNDASLAQGYVKVNGTTSATFTTSGLSTPAATIGSITGMLKASSGVVSQAVAGTDYLTSTSGGTITLATAQTASGTAVDFTGIPSWAKRITVMFNGVSTNGTSVYLIRLGTSSGIDTSGYDATCAYGGAGGQFESNTTGFNITASGFMSSTIAFKGNIQICLISGNSYVSSGVGTMTAAFNSSGSKTLTGTLDRVRITTVNGTDTFDAGTINIMFEG